MSCKGGKCSTGSCGCGPCKLKAKKRKAMVKEHNDLAKDIDKAIKRMQKIERELQHKH